MSRLGMAIILVVLAMNGTVLGQSVLDSVFGPSGLGIWGATQPGQQFDDPRYYGGNPNVDPNQQMAQPPQLGYPQGYGPQNPQQAYGQGYSPDTQGQSAPLSASPQYGPGTVQSPPQSVSQVQRPAPRAGQGQAPRSSRQRVTPPQTSLQTGGRFGDPLPSGAVRITNTTPEGTTVQYYPPAGPQDVDQANIQQPRPRPASSRAPKPQQQATQQEQSGAVRSSIAMPKPVPIPQGQDPRSGWTPNP